MIIFRSLVGSGSSYCTVVGPDSAKRSGSITLERESEKLKKNSINFQHPACLGKLNLISSKIIRYQMRVVLESWEVCGVFPELCRHLVYKRL
jgi:hypothetical protein